MYFTLEDDINLNLKCQEVCIMNRYQCSIYYQSNECEQVTANKQFTLQSFKWINFGGKHMKVELTFLPFSGLKITVMLRTRKFYISDGMRTYMVAYILKP